jgi:hypothetical protein
MVEKPIRSTGWFTLGVLRRLSVSRNANQGSFKSVCVIGLDPERWEVKSSCLTSLTLVLVEGQLWSDESVFWQLKVKDRVRYKVVFSMCTLAFKTSNVLSNCEGKPWFFQLWQKICDRQDGIVWDSDVPRAPVVPPGTPPLVKPVFGPTRRSREADGPAEYATFWGPDDPRTGKTRQDLLDEVPPPPYSP